MRRVKHTADTDTTPSRASALLQTVLIMPTLCVGMQAGRSASMGDAERHRWHYHAERGNDRMFGRQSALLFRGITQHRVQIPGDVLIVPTLCVGMQARRSASMGDAERHRRH
jgi:hypothetical protein